MSDLFQPAETMKAISLWQPWASLAARGVKRHETRRYPTNYRGPVAIHAAKTVDIVGAPERLCLSALGIGWADRVPRGAIVAIMELTSVHRAPEVAFDITLADLEAGNYASDCWTWRMSNIRPLIHPIPTLGRQGLFNWTPPDDLAERLGPVRDHEAECEVIGWGYPASLKRASARGR